MAELWQTIEQAAVSLRLSVRTVNRHIAAGKLQSRLSAEGRREVLVEMPAGNPSAASPFSPDASVSVPGSPLTDTADTNSSSPPYSQPNPSDTFGQTANPAVSVDAETVLALADNAAQKAEMAVAAYQTLARLADTQAQQVRRNARLAWAAVAVMAVGVTGAVGYTTHRLTRATVDQEHLQGELVSATDTVRELSADQDKLRAERIEAERTLRAELIARQDELAAEHATATQTLRTELSAARDQAARAEGKLAAYVEQDEARVARETLAAAASANAAQSAPSANATASSVPVMADIFDMAGTRQQLLLGASAEEENTTSDTATTRPTEGAAVSGATTRPAPAHRKTRSSGGAPTTRPAPTSDTTSASTADDR